MSKKFFGKKYLLALNVPYISESCIEIKINSIFSLRSELGREELVGSRSARRPS